MVLLIFWCGGKLIVQGFLSLHVLPVMCWLFPFLHLLQSLHLARGRILDVFRSSLFLNMVKVLICTQDRIKMKNSIDVEEDSDFADKLECAMSKLSLASNDANVSVTQLD